MDRKTPACLMRLTAGLLACTLGAGASADESRTVERQARLASLFTPAEVGDLANTLPADRTVKFLLRMPADPAPAGVLVFVSPVDSAGFPAQWAGVLDDRRLLWICAAGFGNRKPTAQRMLVAVMALKVARQAHPLDERRLYIAGMSGGGRVASQAITHFPQLFNGAFFIVGADFWMPDQPPLRRLVAARRFVFLTGSNDFNQPEMHRVHDRYRDAGVKRVLFMQQRGFGHELASAAQLSQAVDFLDAR